VQVGVGLQTAVPTVGTSMGHCWVMDGVKSEFNDDIKSLYPQNDFEWSYCVIQHSNMLV